MRLWQLKRRWIVLAFILLAGLVSALVWRAEYRQALDQLSDRARGDLALASDRLTAQLQRYQELAVLMADHPILELLTRDAPGAAQAAEALFLVVADKTAALEVLYADKSGRVLAAASGTGASGLAQTSYFKRALQGALGSGHGANRPLDRRAFYYAAPDFGPDGKVRGALIVAADIDNVEWDWRGSTPAVLFVDRWGQVFISNRSELLFWRRPSNSPGLTPEDGPMPPFSAAMVGGHEIWRMGWGPYLPDRALHLTQALPVIGMTGEVLVDVAGARRLAGLQAGAVAALWLAFGAILFLVTERRRALAAANAVLESRVAHRTRALETTNAQLRREIAEREEAEAALTRAQADLVQAGKLSALGQMSAGISHELNQPLMAIQSFAENGQKYLERDRPAKAGDNLGRIADMAARMARIIRNLRAFVRNESEPMGRVDLVQVIDSAVELTAARLRADNVTVDWTADAHDGPIYAWGGEVRLGQVFVNLINNAADAMMDQEDREIRIRIETGPRLAVTVADIGPGIKDPEKIFEPFYSTKSVGSGDGMGLGLSISYGLVQSFGGRIRGANAARGAIFTVELDPWREDQAA
ncbi:MAG: ATP-binding protein [Pseudomonadota bacterium]